MWSKCRNMLRKCHPWKKPVETDWKSIQAECGVWLGVDEEVKAKLSRQPLNRPEWWKMWLDTVRLDLDSCLLSTKHAAWTDLLFDEPPEIKQEVPETDHESAEEAGTRNAISTSEGTTETEIDDFRFYLHFVCPKGKALCSNSATAIIEHNMPTMLGVSPESVETSWLETTHTAIIDVRSPLTSVRDALLHFEQKMQ